MKGKVKLFEIIKEDDIKSNYLEKYVNLCMVKFKIYDVCRKLLSNVKGYIRCKETKRFQYITDREELLTSNKLLSDSRILTKLFIKEVHNKMLDNYGLMNVTEWFLRHNTDYIYDYFAVIDDHINIIDMLLVLGIEINIFQNEAAENISTIYRLPIDNSILNNYNNMEGLQQHITRRILSDLSFYLAYDRLYGVKPMIDNALNDKYKDISLNDKDVVKKIVSVFSKCNRFDNKLLKRFEKVVTK